MRWRTDRERRAAPGDDIQPLGVDGVQLPAAVVAPLADDDLVAAAARHMQQGVVHVQGSGPMRRTPVTKGRSILTSGRGSLPSRRTLNRPAHQRWSPPLRVVSVTL